jgi:NADPH:quinone reductase-like Zn-dependent oxidoreductase
MANPRISYMLRGLWVSKRSSKKVVSGTAPQRSEDLNYLKELIEAGHLRTVIDRTYQLEQTAEAHRYVETGAKQGNLIIKVSP